MKKVTKFFVGTQLFGGIVVLATLLAVFGEHSPYRGERLARPWFLVQFYGGALLTYASGMGVFLRPKRREALPTRRLLQQFLSLSQRG